MTRSTRLLWPTLVLLVLIAAVVLWWLFLGQARVETAVPMTSAGQPPGPAERPISDKAGAGGEPSLLGSGPRPVGPNVVTHVDGEAVPHARAHPAAATFGVDPCQVPRRLLHPDEGRL